MSLGDSGAVSKTRRRSTALAAAGCAVLMTSALAIAQENQEGIAYDGSYPARVGPWDVILYEHPNYLGPWVRYTLQPDMRQRLVPQIVPALEDKVSSIQVGEKVGVRLFEHRLYCYDGQQGTDRLNSSVPSLGTNTRPIDDKTSSLIIYPNAAVDVVGVELDDVTDKSLGLGLYMPGKGAYFPLPESEGSLEQAYGSLGQVGMDDDANDVSVNVDKRWRDQIQVVLYSEPSLQGRTVMLPGPTGWQGWANDSKGNLGAVNFSDAASSLVVRWVGAPASLGPPPGQPSITRIGINLPGADIRRFETDGRNDECWSACAAETGCKAYTWVKPGVQGPRAVCWLKSSVPASVPNSDCVSGWIEEGGAAKAAAPAGGAAPGQTSAPTKVVIGLRERIRGFEVVQRDGRRVRFRVDYSINSTHGPTIGVGTWLYAAGEAFGGYEPVMFEPQGRGSVEQWVTLPSEARTYDEVEFFFFEPSQQPFLKQRFPFKETWAPMP